MKKNLTFFLTFVILTLSFHLNAKECNQDDTESIGKLKNGLTYYIKENKFHDKKASLRLLVRVGSALETEEERGLAHFLEHMVFRGSENFKDYEIVKYLESIGAEFGPDTNAFTSFDRTCYMLEVPLTNMRDLQKALVFLSDFAFRAKIEDEKVDIERNIVLDELRRSSGPYMRVADKHLSEILKDTIYENRLPIGLEDVIKNCSGDTIRNFYKKWYAPQNMALIAVGDFDKDEVQKYVEKHFSKAEKSENIPNYIVNDSTSTTFSIVHDPEVSIATIELIAREEPKCIEDEQDIKDNIITQIIYDVLNERLQAIGAQNDSPFIAAYAFKNTILQNFCMKGFSVMCWEDTQIQGLEKALYEVEKIKKLGIHEDELARAIQSRKEQIKKANKNLDKIDNDEFLSQYMDHFIFGNHCFPKKVRLEINEKFLDLITAEDVTKRLEDFFANQNWTVCVTLPENAQISENEITATIENVQNTEVIQEDQKVLDETKLLEPKIEIASKIASITKDEKHNLTEVLFENGLKVYLHPTDLKKDEIVIRSYAIGGLGNVSQDIYNSADIALDYFYNSGIAGIDTASFSQLLDLKNSSLNIGLSLNKRNISASTTKANFEDIIKLINRIFTSKNYQDDMWKKTLKIEKEIQKYINLNPDSIFYMAADKIFTCNTYLGANPNLEKVRLEDAKNVIDTFFSNPNDFTFFIVGDFDVDAMILVLKQYLGSISNDKKVPIQLNDLPKIDFPSSDQTHIVRAGMEDKSFCIVGYDIEKTHEPSSKEGYIFSLMRPIIKDKLIQALRLENGKTYGAMNYPSNYFYPNMDHFNYFISFSGPQDDIHTIKDLSINTLRELIATGPTQDELDTAKKIVKNDIKESIQYNKYIAHSLLESHMFSFEFFENDNAMIDSISLEDMTNFIKTIFSKDKCTSVIWLPKEN